MTPIVAARIAINMGIFDFVHHSPKEEFESDEIASHAGGDPLLVCTRTKVPFLCLQPLTAN